MIRLTFAVDFAAKRASVVVFADLLLGDAEGGHGVLNYSVT